MSIATEKLALLRKNLWSYKEIEHHFGFELAGEQPSLLAQFAILSPEFWKDAPVWDRNNQLVSRPQLELFLQRRELLGARTAAVRLAMDVGTLKQVLAAALDSKIVSPSEANGEFEGAYRQTLIGDFYKRFPKLSKMTFVTYSGFIKLLHAEIHEFLGIEVAPLYCATSQILDASSPEFANDYDAITGEPMGIAYQVWLETGKPIQLAPDACSWKTYFAYEGDLKSEIWGRIGEDMEKSRNALTPANPY